MIAALILGATLNITTPVHCHTTGETWNDTRTTEQLLEIGAHQLCNGAGIRQGSKITDQQRQILNTIIVTTVIAATTTRMRTR